MSVRITDNRWHCNLQQRKAHDRALATSHQLVGHPGKYQPAAPSGEAGRATTNRLDFSFNRVHEVHFAREDASPGFVVSAVLIKQVADSSATITQRPTPRRWASATLA